MDQEKKLYPMHLCTILDEYAWGSEEFKIADLGYRDTLIRDGWLAGNSLSEVMDTYLDRVTGEANYEYSGRQFPFTLKYIRCKGKQPLQVHPDDELAAQRYDLLGKAKFWYVLEAGKDAMAYVGFRKDTDASELLSRCEDGSLETILNGIALHKGQSILINPGTVNALTGDVLVAEVSEASPMDFCVWSWGEPLPAEEFDPEFSLVDALDFIDYKAWKAPHTPSGSEGPARRLAVLPQFSVSLLQLDTPVRISTERFGSCQLYNCVSGEASVQIDVLGQKSQTIIKKGETVLVPDEISSFVLEPLSRGTSLLEIFRESVEQADPYINPDAAPALEDD